MSWLAFITALIKAVGFISQWLHDRGLMDAGQAKQVALDLEAQSDAIKKALAAREAVRGDLAIHPDRVQDDDGFRRD